MKNLIIGFFFLFIALNAFSKDYPVKNFQYIDEYDFSSHLNSNKIVAVVFSNSSCLERTYPDRSCMLFERKFDYFVPSFANKVKVIAADLYFQNYSLPQMYQISMLPTVVLFIDGFEVAREEANIRIFDFNTIQLNWEDDLLNRSLQMINKINP